MDGQLSGTGGISSTPNLAGGGDHSGSHPQRPRLRRAGADGPKRSRNGVDVQLSEQALAYLRLLENEREQDRDGDQ